MKSSFNAAAAAFIFFICIGLGHAENLNGTLWLKNNSPAGTQSFKAFYDGHLYTAVFDNETDGWTKLAYTYLEAPTEQGAYNFMSYADRRRIPFFNRGLVDLSSTCFLGVCDPDNGSATICTIEQDHHLGFGTIRRTLCAKYTLQHKGWEPDAVKSTSRYTPVASATVAGQTFACLCDYPPGTFVWYFDFSGSVYEKARKPDKGLYEKTDSLAGIWSRTGNVLTVTFNDSYKAESNIALLTGGYPVKALLGLFKILQISGFTYDEGEPFYCDCTRVYDYDRVLNGK